MAKKIFSGLFVLTAVGALGIIVSGAIAEGDQLLVRFLTAVVVAALGLYVVSDLRLQANRSERTHEQDMLSAELEIDLTENAYASEPVSTYVASKSYEAASLGAASVGYDMAELEDLRDSLNSYEPTNSLAELAESSDSASDLVDLVQRVAPVDDQFAWPVSGEVPQVQAGVEPEDLKTVEPERIVRQELVDSLESAIEEFAEGDASDAEGLMLVETDSEKSSEDNLALVGGDDDVTEVGLDLASIDAEALATADNSAGFNLKQLAESSTPLVVEEPNQIQNHKPEAPDLVSEASEVEDLNLVIEAGLAAAEVEDLQIETPVQDSGADVAAEAVVESVVAPAVDETFGGATASEETVIDLTSEVDQALVQTDESDVIDLRSKVDVEKYEDSLSQALALGEETVVDTLISQGMLSTEGEITDRDVRTMVYVAFTSNELKKLIQAGGMPGEDHAQLDLGPVELFDETEFSPAPKLLYRSDEGAS